VAKPARCLHSSATCLQQNQPIDAANYSFSSRVQPPVDGDQVARDYQAFKHHQAVTNRIGSVVSPTYQPHTQVTKPPPPEEISLELLLASQSHLGHSTSLWNPANARYIFGVRQGIHIISLDQTASHLRRACAVVRAVAQRGGLILFVGTREGHERIVVKAAELAGGCHLFDRWIPGSITNGPQILGRCRMRVVDENDQEVKGFEEQLETKGALKPDLVVCLNPLENYVLLHECGLNNIPTIGVIDTDANPTWVTYPIPANDDRYALVLLAVSTHHH
jgi:small subunit ribosomal protein S2